MTRIPVTVDLTAVESKLSYLETRIKSSDKAQNRVRVNMRFAYIQWSQLMRSSLSSFKDVAGIKIAMGALDIATYADMMVRFQIEAAEALATPGRQFAAVGLYGLMLQTSVIRVAAMRRNEQLKWNAARLETINITKDAY